MTIIALPRVSPARLGRPGPAASDPRRLPPCRTVQRLLADIEDATPAHAEDWARTVAALLGQSLAAADDLAGLPWGQGSGGQPARLDLAQTRSLRIFARRWQPGAVGPLRRFMDWFAYGVAEGALVEVRYPEGHLPAGCAGVLARGEVRHGPGDGLSLRRLANHAAETALSLHIEGLPQRLTARTAAVMPVEADPWPALRPRPRLTVIPGGRGG